MRYLLLFLIAISCNETQSKSEVKTEKEIVQSQDLISITCSIITQNDKRKIYQLKNDSIFLKNKKEKLPPKEIDVIKDYPVEILRGNQKYGCGVCMDGVDFEFKFQFDERTTTYEVQPNTEVPKSIQVFLDLLTDKYTMSLKQ